MAKAVVVERVRSPRADRANLKHVPSTTLKEEVAELRRVLLAALKNLDEEVLRLGLKVDKLSEAIECIPPPTVLLR